MNRFSILLFLVFASTSLSAQALPILLEKNYTNYAWGYQNNGCMVDEAGFVYTYDLRSEEPMSNIGRATAEQINLAQNMLRNSRSGSLDLKRTAYDAGTLLWSGHFYGEVIPLKQTGDYTGTNTARDTASLVQLIDQLCED